MPEASKSHRAFFDLWSRVYDARPVQWAVYRPVHEAVLAELRAPPARGVLDVGCGTGILTSRLASVLSGLVCGCDLSLGMLRQASRRRVGPWVQADALRLPVRDRSLEAVVSTESFHWFTDHDAVLRELHRVVVPGGRVLVALINVRTGAMSRAAHTWSSRAGQPAHWPTQKEMRSRLEAAGFDVRRQQRVLRIFGVMVPTILTVAVRRP